jgi:HD-GYP domain-containing protein (c-di-GMP phosphodiesterase class II)
LRIGIKIQFIFMAILLVVLTVSVSSFFFIRQEREVLLREMSRRGVSIARNLATASTDSVVGGDRLVLATLVTSTLQNEGVSYAMILDDKAVILAHNKVENVGKSYVEPAGVRPLTNETVLIQPYKNESGEKIVDVTLPILLRNGVRIGTVSLGMSQKSIDALVEQAFRDTVGIAVALVLVGVLIAVFFIHMMLKPVASLVRGARALGEGNLNYQIRLKGKDEFAVLARAFNEMGSRLKELYIGMLRAMAKTLESRDKFAGGHDQRVSEYASACAAYIGMPEDEVDNIRLAAQVQNIGNIAVPDVVLEKTGKLTEEEYERLKKHVETGAEILNQVQALRGAVPLVMHHHERYDGNGYPKGLKGKDIPLGARILSVADAFDAMTSAQKHRQAMTRFQALEELKRGSGTQFDPEIVEAYIEMFESKKEAQAS